MQPLAATPPGSLAHLRCLPPLPVSAQLRALRQLLADRFPDARPLVERDAHRVARSVATGLEGLDGALPHGGFPRGKLTVWVPTGGAAAVLRAACRSTIAGGERAAWVDASRTVTFGWGEKSAQHHSTMAPPTRRMREMPTEAGHEWSDGTPLVIHATDRMAALRCAEALLASGAFALVVLDGAEAMGTETVRLARAVREGGGAFVALTERGSMAAVRITSRLDPHGVRWRSGPFGDPAELVEVRAEVRVRALGWNARADLRFPVARYDLRDALEPGAPDRRGAGSPAPPVRRPPPGRPTHGEPG